MENLLNYGAISAWFRPERGDSKTLHTEPRGTRLLNSVSFAAAR